MHHSLRPDPLLKYFENLLWLLLEYYSTVPRTRTVFLDNFSTVLLFHSHQLIYNHHGESDNIRYPALTDSRISESNTWRAAAPRHVTADQSTTGTSLSSFQKFHPDENLKLPVDLLSSSCRCQSGIRPRFVSCAILSCSRTPQWSEFWGITINTYWLPFFNHLRSNGIQQTFSC